MAQDTSVADADVTTTTTDTQATTSQNDTDKTDTDTNQNKDKDADSNKDKEQPKKKEEWKPVQPKITMYRAQGIYFENKPSYRILQDQGGPCPLIGICNVLLLRGDITIHDRRTKDIPYAQLTRSLQDHLQRNFEKNFLTKAGVSEEQIAIALQNIEDCVQRFPKLEDGLDINIKWADCDQFEFTPEVAMFDTYHARLLHGWVIDPQDKDLHRLIGKLSYNETVDWLTNDQYDKKLTKEQIEEIEKDKQIVRRFLQEYSHQLTPYGLQRVTEAVKDKDVAVLFRNNHFACVYKHQGRLFELCTDEGIIDADYRITWQTLSSIYGDTQYAENDFRIMGGFEINASQHYVSHSQLKQEEDAIAASLRDEKAVAAMAASNVGQADAAAAAASGNRVDNKDDKDDTTVKTSTTTTTDTNVTGNDADADDDGDDMVLFDANGYLIEPDRKPKVLKQSSTDDNIGGNGSDMDIDDPNKNNIESDDKNGNDGSTTPNVSIVKNVDTDMEKEKKIEETQDTQLQDKNIKSDSIDEATRAAIKQAQLENQTENDAAMARLLQDEMSGNGGVGGVGSGNGGNKYIGENEKREIEKAMGWQTGSFDQQTQSQKMTVDEFNKHKRQYNQTGQKPDNTNCIVM